MVMESGNCTVRDTFAIGTVLTLRSRRRRMEAKERTRSSSFSASLARWRDGVRRTLSAVGAFPSGVAYHLPGHALPVGRPGVSRSEFSFGLAGFSEPARSFGFALGFFFSAARIFSARRAHQSPPVWLLQRRGFWLLQPLPALFLLGF